VCAIHSSANRGKVPCHIRLSVRWCISFFGNHGLLFTFNKYTNLPQTFPIYVNAPVCFLFFYFKCFGRTLFIIALNVSMLRWTICTGDSGQK
jgi:hypothetical protein